MMKKRSVLILAAFAFLAFAIPAQAQTTLYIGAGGSFPTGDFGDYANTGWIGTAGALFAVGAPGLSAGAEFFYGQNNHKSELSEDVDSKTTPWGFMGILDYSFGEAGSIQPYLFGGAGVLIHKFSTEGFSESETKFGWEFGAGLAFPIGATSSIYAEGRYVGSEYTKYFAALAGFAFDL